MLETKNYHGGKRKFPGYQKRTTEQRETDVLFCSELFLKGYTYREISKMLNEANAKAGRQYTISAQSVYKDMERCLIEWKRQRLQNIDDYVTQELRKLDRMEVALWTAWEESRTGKRREKNRTSAKPRKVLTEEEKTADWYGYDETQTETSAGNPRFMDLLLNVQQRRAKLLGYDAPVKVDIVPGRKDDETEKYNFDSIPDELLFAVVDKLQQSKFVETMKLKGGKQ
jgi:hypothetical protein